MRKNTDNPYLSAQARTEHQAAVLENVAAWASYYRSNPHRFAIDFLHLRLTIFQMILLVMMNISTTAVFIGCRGIGKTFICAVFCVIRAVLWPGTKTCIASGTRGQGINVLEKITGELKQWSPELAQEIDEKNTNMNNTTAQIAFRNGSVIKVVTATDSSRGNRAHILIIDEFRMVKKDVIDTVLRKFLAGPRHPRYMDLPEYIGDASLREPNKSVYLSSGWYKDHWSFTRCTDSCRFMLDETKHNFVCGLPYQLAVAEGMLMEDDVVEQMLASDFSEVKWAMEMEAMFWGETDGSFFSYEAVSKNRHIQMPMLPADVAARFPQATTKLRAPTKGADEKRILSADIALMATTKHANDASSIFINQMMPTKTGRYMNNIVYTENNEGFRTEEQALRIRKLYEEFDCDYIVLDVRSVGLSIFDALSAEMSDPDTGEIYPALSCCNNEDIAARCVVPDAPKVIWAISATSKLNSDCALTLREAFKSGRVRLLLNEYDAEEMFNGMKGFSVLSPADKLAITLPYINTTLLINELINLRHETANGMLRVFEKAGARKDRYSSLAYNIYVSSILEKDYNRQRAYDFYETSTSAALLYRAPKIKA